MTKPSPCLQLRTIQNVASALLRFALVGIVAIASSAELSCRRESAPEDVGLPYSGSFDKAALLTALSKTVQGRQEQLLKEATDLEAATRAFVADSAKRSDAQIAWRKTMSAMQQLDAMRLGPLAQNASPGGRDLRDPLYSWPVVSRCAVEQAIAQKAYEDPNFNVIAFVNTRGLATLEYLLFYPGDDNACPSENPLNANNQWATLSTEERSLRKQAYALVVAQDVHKRAQELVRAWQPEGGGFATELPTAGKGSKVFATERAALNAVSDPIFSLSIDLKNMKVGKPLGITGCLTASCPEAWESTFARASGAHVRSNLAGMRAILFGEQSSADLAFDDLLRAIGAGEFAARLEAHLMDALAKAEAVMDFEAALAADPTQIRALYDALKVLEVDLKTEFASLLNLELPKVVEGDND
jgi:uncharacterized protein